MRAASGNCLGLTGHNEEAEMTKRTGLVWLSLLMAVSIVVSGCSGVLRGEAGNGTPVDVGTMVGDGLAPVDEIELMIRESLPYGGPIAALARVI
jgi:hypothetical protein